MMVFRLRQVLHGFHAGLCIPQLILKLSRGISTKWFVLGGRASPGFALCVSID
jgi:hypothetical protein